jgi:hypothetical protein
MNTFLVDNLKYVKQVRSQMSEYGVMLCYRGEMSQDIVIALLNLTENKISQTTSDANIKTRVFIVMVECLQNITQHSDKSEHVSSNVFMIGQADHGYTIYSGNVMKSEKVDVLKDKLMKINTMSEDELKEFYKYIIKNDQVSDESGHGLGLIQIARKTGNPLDFDFEQIDDKHYFFSLRTLVDH